ncbi:hypothetical protein J3B02_004399 [Coemansia erecta]|uniref:Uncharacterized protein n=1 Tax=Coemansia asiatica TaxID=1052880 RepID=A0A9W8CL34_9FUNG|nr:hypothetical protein LPJ64_000894 [Coemansia asiatica]KAJ2846478.1 hypothetical protein J3B02_004399 [Coemansia erecta]KAJ2882481.1 hypothetical protein FB639_002384 [Coemansia asiatica]
MFFSSASVVSASSIAAAALFLALTAHGQWVPGSGSNLYYGATGMAAGYPAGTMMGGVMGGVMGGYPAQPAAAAASASAAMMFGGYANAGGYIPTGFGHGVIQGASTGGTVIQGPSGTIIVPPQSAGSIVF